MTGIKGQDWSGYQPPQPSVQGLDFVFIKATEGLTYTNPNLQRQYEWAHRQGLVVGLYHYPHMGNSVRDELARFLHIAAARPGDMLCLDWEGYDQANLNVSHGTQAAFKDEWLQRIAAAMPGHRSGTYCNVDYLNNVDATGRFGDFLWIATAGRAAGEPGILHPWLFHQYSSVGAEDVDYCRLPTRAALAAWAALSPPADVPPPAPLKKELDMIMVSPPMTNLPTGTSWPGDFLLTGDGRMTHIPQPADVTALRAVGVQGPAPISRQLFDALMAGK